MEDTVECSPYVFALSTPLYFLHTQHYCSGRRLRRDVDEIDLERRCELTTVPWARDAYNVAPLVVANGPDAWDALVCGVHERFPGRRPPADRSRRRRTVAETGVASGGSVIRMDEVAKDVATRDDAVDRGGSAGRRAALA